MMTNKEITNNLSSLQQRISQLSDEVHRLKTELKQFKSNVASDVKYLTERAEPNNQ